MVLDLSTSTLTCGHCGGHCKITVITDLFVNNFRDGSDDYFDCMMMENCHTMWMKM